MKFIKLAMTSVLMLSAASFAQAQDIQQENTLSKQNEKQDSSKIQDKGFYGTLGVTTYELQSYSTDIKLGYYFNEYFGVEAQGVVGVSRDSRPIASFEGAATISSKPEYTIGTFAVARLPISESVEIFARGGIHNTRTNIRINNALGTDLDQDRTGFAAGVGMQYNLDSKNGLRADYTYLDNNSSSFGSRNREIVSLAYVRKF